jgi:hypothetical protein
MAAKRNSPVASVTVEREPPIMTSLLAVMMAPAIG